MKRVTLAMLLLAAPEVLLAEGEPRELSAEQLMKIQSSVQKSKLNVKADEARLRQEKERSRQELVAYEAWLEKDAAARRPAQQNIASVFVNTFNNEVQKNQTNKAAFDARIANTIQSTQQKEQREIKEIEPYSLSSRASPQVSQSNDQEFLKATAAERERLQKVEQQKKEAEQKQLAISQKKEEEKRQKEVEHKKREELNRQEAVNYANAIRTGTRVGAISCGSSQRTHIVGILGRAQRPKHIYTDCRLQEVRYRCPSESSWQYRSHNLWQLNNACIGVGDDMVVSANCPAEQLIVQATRFSCEVEKN